MHASLLPKYRGAAPIQWAIANGERKTGVTIMRIDAGLDTGDMLLKQEVSVEPDETAPQLRARLAPIGAELLVEAIRRIANGTLTPEPQNNLEASYAPMLKKADGLIDWGHTAQQIYDRLRGFCPWPGAYTTFRGQQLSILTARPAESVKTPAGTLQVQARKLFAGCGEETTLELLEIQIAGKKAIRSDAFINGYKLISGERFG